MEMRASARVREHRIRLDWTVKDLAAKSGIHKATLYRIDKGVQEPTVEELERIVAAMGMTMAELYGGRRRSRARRPHRHRPRTSKTKPRSTAAHG